MIAKNFNLVNTVAVYDEFPVAYLKHRVVSNRKGCIKKYWERYPVVDIIDFNTKDVVKTIKLGDEYLDPEKFNMVCNERVIEADMGLINMISQEVIEVMGVLKDPDLLAENLFIKYSGTNEYDKLVVIRPVLVTLFSDDEKIKEFFDTYEDAEYHYNTRIQELNGEGCNLKTL